MFKYLSGEESEESNLRLAYLPIHSFNNALLKNTYGSWFFFSKNFNLQSNLYFFSTQILQILFAKKVRKTLVPIQTDSILKVLEAFITWFLSACKKIFLCFLGCKYFNAINFWASTTFEWVRLVVLFLEWCS